MERLYGRIHCSLTISVSASGLLGLLYLFLMSLRQVSWESINPVLSLASLNALINVCVLHAGTSESPSSMSMTRLEALNALAARNSARNPRANVAAA